MFFSNQTREKSYTLEFSKLMICMQQLQYKSPHRMYVLPNLSGNDTPDPLLVLGLRIGPVLSKIMAARLCSYHSAQQKARLSQ